MIAKAKYDDRMRFAKIALLGFKEIKEGYYDNKKPYETNVFVGYFDECAWMPETENRVECFSFKVMDFYFIITVKIRSWEGKHTIILNTSEEVKDVERLKEWPELYRGQEPFMPIPNLTINVDEKDNFHFNRLNSKGECVQAQESKRFFPDVTCHYLQLLQQYIEKVEAEEFSNIS